MYHRAGFEDSAEFLRSLSETISTIENSPASKLMSAEASSLAAPFIDAALHRQRTNLSNTSLSYYLKGELIALNLDLLIRGKTKGQRSLDDVMRRAYDEFYRKSPNASYYLKGRGYTIEDFNRVVSEIAGTEMNEFFAKYVRGTELLPYHEALQAVGLRLVKSPANLPYTGGIVIDQQNDQTFRLGALRNDSPAERGGLQEGDVLVSIGGMPVTRENWAYVLNGFKQGDRIPITVRRFRENLNVTIQLAAPEVYDYRIEEDPGASAQVRALRQAWLRGN
jgi:predicted metalloprotease with PDZ domain